MAGSITEEIAVAVPAERMWKAAFCETKKALLPKACAGYIDVAEVDGDGGPGSIITFKLNPSLGENKALQSRVVALDEAARMVKTEVLQGSTVSALLKTNVAEKTVEAAGDGACVVRVKIDYETIDGAALAPEDQAKLGQGYVRIVKMVEAYLVAHPDELA